MRVRIAIALALTLAALGGSARAERRDPATVEQQYQDEVSDRSYFQFARIEVRVSGKALTLMGVVGSETDRALAEAFAHAQPGVGWVVCELTVDESLPRWRPSPAEDRHRKARNIMRFLRQDPDLALFSTLRVLEDITTLRLRGNVAEPWQHRRANELAREVAQGMSLTDEICVDPGASRIAPGPGPDAQSNSVERELEALLAADPILHDGPRLHVKVRDGYVFLSGRARDIQHHDYVVLTVERRVRGFDPSERPARAPGPLERRLLTGVADGGAYETAEIPASATGGRYVVVSNIIVES
jgi:osmotically-inducible protein OsmY